jgi:hypothetical protein
VSECFFWKLRGFSHDFFTRVFEIPLLRNAQKNAPKQVDEKKKEELVTIFVSALQQMYVTFVICFSRRPLNSVLGQARSKEIQRISSLLLRGQCVFVFQLATETPGPHGPRPGVRPGYDLGLMADEW